MGHGGRPLGMTMPHALLWLTVNVRVRVSVANSWYPLGQLFCAHAQRDTEGEYKFDTTRGALEALTLQP